MYEVIDCGESSCRNDVPGMSGAQAEIFMSCGHLVCGPCGDGSGRIKRRRSGRLLSINNNLMNGFGSGRAL